MALYKFTCAECSNETEEFIPMKDIVNSGEIQPNVKCNKCGKEKLKKELNQGIFGEDAVKEPWQYEFTHQAKPKFVKDSKGNRIKFNPNTMGKGRKGSGR